MRLAKPASALADDEKTPMFVAVDGRPAGIVAVADTVKEDSRDAIPALTSMKLEVVMITGDNERTAKAIARHVVVERVLAEVLPQDKAFKVQKGLGVSGIRGVAGTRRGRPRMGVYVAYAPLYAPPSRTTRGATTARRQAAPSSHPPHSRLLLARSILRSSAHSRSAS